MKVIKSDSIKIHNLVGIPTENGGGKKTLLPYPVSLIFPGGIKVMLNEKMGMELQILDGSIVGAPVTEQFLRDEGFEPHMDTLYGQDFKHYKRGRIILRMLKDYWTKQQKKDPIDITILIQDVSDPDTTIHYKRVNYCHEIQNVVAELA